MFQLVMMLPTYVECVSTEEVLYAYYQLAFPLITIAGYSMISIGPLPANEICCHSNIQQPYLVHIVFQQASK